MSRLDNILCFSRAHWSTLWVRRRPPCASHTHTHTHLHISLRLHRASASKRSSSPSSLPHVFRAALGPLRRVARAARERRATGARAGHVRERRPSIAGASPEHRWSGARAAPERTATPTPVAARRRTASGPRSGRSRLMRRQARLHGSAVLMHSSDTPRRACSMWRRQPLRRAVRCAAGLQNDPPRKRAILLLGWVTRGPFRVRQAAGPLARASRGGSGSTFVRPLLRGRSRGEGVSLRAVLWEAVGRRRRGPRSGWAGECDLRGWRAAPLRRGRSGRGSCDGMVIDRLRAGRCRACFAKVLRPKVAWANQMGGELPVGGPPVEETA